MRAGNDVTTGSNATPRGWDDPAEMLARAKTAEEQGDHALAYQLYASASELSPQDSTAWEGRARNADSADETLVSYAYASALDPNNSELTQTLDGLLKQRLASATRDDEAALLAIGQEFAEVGFSAKAESVFRRAVELDNSSSDALVWLAGMLDEPEQQIEYLERALAMSPLDPRARAALLTLKPMSTPSPAPVTTPAPSITSATARPSTLPATPPIKRPATGDTAIPATPSPAPVPTPRPAPPTENVATLLAQAEATTDDDKRLELYERVLLLDPANSGAREARTMLRVRRLRETARLADAEPTTSRSATPRADSGLVNSPTVSNNRLRSILVILLVLVLILLVAGLYLTFVK